MAPFPKAKNKSKCHSRSKAFFLRSLCLDSYEKTSLGWTGASCGHRRKDTRMEGSQTKGDMSKLERSNILAALLAIEMTLKKYH